MSVYEIITDKIIDMLEAGNVPWRKPWNEVTAPRSLATGKTYRGLNLFLLAAAGQSSPWWGTRNQIHERGGHIDGELWHGDTSGWKFGDQYQEGTVILFWRLIDHKTEKDDRGRPKKIPLLRYYRVWNLDQTEGVKLTKGERSLEDFEPLSEDDQNANAELIIKSWNGGPRVRHDSKGAYWDALTDVVHLPKRATFKSSSDYYATRFHEMGHSTGSASRLGRHKASDQFKFASHAYGREELVAEMTAAFLMGHAGILQDTEENNAAYLRSWVNTLREDSHVVVKAASEAQAAADLILGVEKEEASA